MRPEKKSNFQAVVHLASILEWAHRNVTISTGNAPGCIPELIFPVGGRDSAECTIRVATSWPMF
jgi:hypothetical protein